MHDRYDIIVIGGGHAGTEAAWAAASALGDEGRVALITMDPSRIGQMSCNPAIGGLAKGQIVREIDALGGLMARAIDATGIMFHVLNTSKGAAVRGPRAQADKYAYAAEVQRLISTRPNIDVIAGTVDDLLVENGHVVGVVVPPGCGIVNPDPSAIEQGLTATTLANPVYPSCSSALSRSASSSSFRAPAVILTTGTFMRGLLHTGDQQTAGGRVGEGAASHISGTLRRLGFELGRLKTGTPPRLARETIDWEALEPQTGDEPPRPFSDLSPHGLPGGRFPRLRQTECRSTHTTPSAHELIRANLDRAPLFTGQITADAGPRYCPSIEDKIVRFPDRETHHVFLEPESLHTNEIYCNGISTSLPTDVQEQIVHAMPGCARAEILRWGYAVEYDMVWPHQIDATCMTKRVRGLFFAGQINCTTGYEEAGGQGVIAGLNAARLVREQEPVMLRRDQAYIGVMMDDLVTRTPREPYRMFTSRAEHRLLLRADTADRRLTPSAQVWGLIEHERWQRFEQRRDDEHRLIRAFDTVRLDGQPLRRIARRPGVSVDTLCAQLPEEFARDLVERVAADAKYDGYVQRQSAEVRRQAEADRRRIPHWLDYPQVTGLRAEAVEVLDRFRPTTLGQASRLAGVTPADVALLAVRITRGASRPA